jgi:hypothetical protein
MVSQLLSQGLLASATRTPWIHGPSDFYRFLETTSRDFLASEQPLSPEEIRVLGARKAEALGLSAEGLDAHLAEGLRQEGALSADEQAEFQRYLRRLLPESIEQQRPPSYAEIIRCFELLARQAIQTLGATLPPPARSRVVFLGSDAEFQKVPFDVMCRDPLAAGGFYLSRRALMTPAEFKVLWATRREVFGEEQISRHIADGTAADRDYCWADNSLMYSTVYQLIDRARREQGREGTSGGFGRALAALFAEELSAGTLQRRRQERGWLTLFGRRHPAVDELIAQGIRERLFARTCLSLVRNFHAAYLADCREITLADVGSTGTQPCLLLGAVGALSMLEPGVLAEQLPLTAEDVALLQDLRRSTPRISVVLYASSPRTWGSGSEALYVHKLTAEFAFAVEMVKTVRPCTHAPDGTGNDLIELGTAEQQLLAYLKHLIFRNAALAAHHGA